MVMFCCRAAVLPQISNNVEELLKCKETASLPQIPLQEIQPDDVLLG